ncbi:NIPSNAP family protein [Reichenbachiella sp. MALMAid0571]|uniref:NIPSNAP family protein n=1 Tax=Reichenbachiella sp. MALMAid0571 TaxID=3143939 RepID=UPI0032DF89A6
MKSAKYLVLLVIVLALANCENKPLEEKKVEEVVTSGREFYQLKVYTFDTETQVAVTDAYLKEAYIPAVKKLGIESVGVFRQKITETDTLLKMYVLIPFTSMDELISIDGALEKDQTYLAAGNAYINAAHDQTPYKRFESIIMQAFEEMPMMQASPVEGDRSARVYELRSYESATEKLYKNKVDMFNAGGEVKLFDRLGFNAVFYGEVISGSKMPNLMYMTTFSNQAKRDSLWNEFFTAPEWEILKADPKYQKNVSHADKIFLYPTEYSDY